MNYQRRRAFTTVEMLIVYLLPIFIISFWTWRNFEFWVCYAKQTPTADTPYLLSLLISIIWPLAFVLNVLSEVVRCFI